MITKDICDVLSKILNEILVPQHRDSIQSIECDLISKYYTDADNMIRVVVKLYNVGGGFSDEAYHDFRMYCEVLGVNFFDYELRYGVAI